MTLSGARLAMVVAVFILPGCKTTTKPCCDCYFSGPTCSGFSETPTPHNDWDEASCAQHCRAEYNLCSLVSSVAGECGQKAQPSPASADAGRSSDGTPGGSKWQSCTWQGAASTKTESLSLNNAAELEGAVPNFVQVAGAAATVNATGLASSFSISAYVTSSSIAPVIITVTNPGTELFCSLQGKQLSLSSADGLSKSTPGDVLFVGSEGTSDGSFYAADCLGPNETGYLWPTVSRSDADPNNLSTTVIAFDLERCVPPTAKNPCTTAPGGTLSSGQLTPIGYDLGECDGVSAVKITVRNDGEVDVKPTMFSQMIAIDDMGLPVDASYLEASPAATTVSPGATANLYANVFTGFARLRVYTDFKSP
jgi:hypothetical protein